MNRTKQNKSIFICGPLHHCVFFFFPSLKQNSVPEKVTQVSLVFPQKQSANQPKNTGECFTTKLKSVCKNSGTFEEKKFTQKSHLPGRSLLHQAIQLLAILGFHFLNAAIRF